MGGSFVPGAELPDVALFRRQPVEEPVDFTCNICGARRHALTTELDREIVSCECGSTVRMRSVIAALSVSLFGKSLTMAEFPTRDEVVGPGMSDWVGYASRLTEHLSYTNTFYDQEPRFDLAQPVPNELVGSCDFVICSDVIEHMPSPYQIGLAHCLDLLKPGGYLILTVPMKPEGTTDEHFPDLFDFRIVEFGQDRVLVNRTRSGSYQVFDNLIFHGGPGFTLEMRVLSIPDALRNCTRPDL